MSKAKVIHKDGLFVRKDKSRSSEWVRIIPCGEEFEFYEEYKGWLKVADGWVVCSDTYIQPVEVKGGAGSWNDLEDKPFDSVSTEIPLIEIEDAYVTHAPGPISDYDIKPGDPVRARMIINSEEVVIDSVWEGVDGDDGFIVEDYEKNVFFKIRKSFSNLYEILWIDYTEDDVRVDQGTTMRIYALSEDVTTIDPKFMPDPAKFYVYGGNIYHDEYGMRGVTAAEFSKIANSSRFLLVDNSVMCMPNAWAMDENYYAIYYYHVNESNNLVQTKVCTIEYTPK